MSQKVVNKYRVYCITDSKYIYIWDTTIPTKCNENDSHNIDHTTITIVETVDTSLVNIDQDGGKTGGHYCCESRSMSITSTGTITADFTFPINISAISVNFITTNEHVNDSITTYIAPNTTIGINIRPINPNDNELYVSDTVLQNIKLGFLCNGIDPSTGVTDDYGRVLAIDSINKKITVEKKATKLFTLGKLIQMSIRNINNLEFNTPSKYEIAGTKLGSSYIPANTIIRIQYTNRTNMISNTKKFVWFIEYYY